MLSGNLKTEGWSFFLRRKTKHPRKCRAALTVFIVIARFGLWLWSSNRKFSGGGLDVMSLNGPLQDGATEFMCHYPSLPENLVPVNLRSFILNVSLGIQQVGQRTAWKELYCRTCLKGQTVQKNGGPVVAFLSGAQGVCCFAAAACGRFSTSSASSSVQLPQHAECLVR